MSEVGESLGRAPLDGSAAAARMTAGLVTLLEERIASLVERHQGARKRIEELSAALEEREGAITELARQAGRHVEIQHEIRERVGHLIEQVGELEQLRPEGRAE